MNYGYIVNMMIRNDPNGDYCVEDIMENPGVYLEILRGWLHELKAANKQIPGWLIVCIDKLVNATK